MAAFHSTAELPVRSHYRVSVPLTDIQHDRWQDDGWSGGFAVVETESYVMMAFVSSQTCFVTSAFSVSSRAGNRPPVL
jgi:hypothetical protein